MYGLKRLLGIGIQLKYVGQAIVINTLGKLRRTKKLLGRIEQYNS